MRTCHKCSKKKTLDEFNFKNKRIGLRQKICKLCTRAQIRAHYYNNRQYYLDKTIERNRKVRKAIRKYIWDFLLTHPCRDCGESDPVVLEFDHQRDKKISISKTINNNISIDKLKEEILKCTVRCANCHRKKTALELNWYRSKFAPVAQLDRAHRFGR